MISLTGKRSRKNNPPGGFTLIELVFVIVVIAAIAAVSTPMFKRTYDDLQLSVSAKEMAALMRFCHERAVFERIDCRLYVYPEKNTYRMHIFDDESGEFEPVPGRWGRSFKVKQGVKIETETEYVDFFPDGTATPAAVYLTGKDNRSLAVIVEGGTGSANIHENEDK